MQICQGAAEIIGIVLHYSLAKNLTLCWYKFTGRFMKINIYLHIHDTQPVDWFVWTQLPAVKAHSSSVRVAAVLSAHLWFLTQQHTRVKKSVLTLLFHKRNRQVPKYSSTAIPSILLDLVQMCWFSSSRIYPYEFRLWVQLPAWCVGMWQLSHGKSARVCICVCTCVHRPQQRGYNSRNRNLNYTSMTAGYAKTHCHVSLRNWECAHGLLIRQAWLLKLW